MGAKKQMRDQIERMMMQQFQQLQAPDPTIVGLQNMYQGILNWDSGTGGAKDLYKHPTLNTLLAPYQIAMSSRDAGRVGRGLGGATTDYKDPYAKEKAMEDESMRKMMASSQLEEALRGETANASNALPALSALDTQRKTAGNSMMQYMHDDLNQRIAAGGWGGFLRGLMGSLPGLAALGAAPFTGGASLGMAGASAAGPGASAAGGMMGL